MSDILEIIKSRRTIKEFVPKFVSWEKISRVLDAGRHAPSAGNLQNWKFLVIFDAGQKQQLAEACYGQYEISQAWVLIIVVGESERAIRYYGDRGKFYTIQNCAAAMQNMLLEAHSIGLGSKWVGAFEEDTVKSSFGILADVDVQGIVALGYPKDIPAKPPKYPLEPITYFSSWRSRLRDPHKYMNNIAIILGRKKEKVKAAMAEAGSKLIEKSKEVLKKD
jgi:nitroreductase